MDADGSDRIRLSSCADVGTGGRSANCDGPSFSADGKSVIFQSDKSETSDNIDSPFQIRTWIIGADGTNERVLFDTALNSGIRPWTDR
jgi:Tol biopolymer transport system component